MAVLDRSVAYPVVDGHTDLRQTLVAVLDHASWVAYEGVAGPWNDVASFHTPGHHMEEAVHSDHDRMRRVVVLHEKEVHPFEAGEEETYGEAEEDHHSSPEEEVPGHRKVDIHPRLWEALSNVPVRRSEEGDLEVVVLWAWVVPEEEVGVHHLQNRDGVILEEMVDWMCWNTIDHRIRVEEDHKVEDHHHYEVTDYWKDVEVVAAYHIHTPHVHIVPHVHIPVEDTYHLHHSHDDRLLHIDPHMVAYHNEEVVVHGEDTVQVVDTNHHHTMHLEEDDS